MQHLSDALIDFLDEIHPRILTSSKDQNTNSTFIDAESVVITALNEAVAWATPLINQWKLYQVCETVTYLHSLKCMHVYQQWKLSFVDMVYFHPVNNKFNELL